MELLETIPTMELTSEDIETATPQLEEERGIYSPLFNRCELAYTLVNNFNTNFKNVQIFLHDYLPPLTTTGMSQIGTWGISY